MLMNEDDNSWTLSDSLNVTRLDSNTCRYLELIESTRNVRNDKQGSLLAVLNHTNTKLGLRKLRDAIVRPSSDVEVIRARAELVARLLTDFNLNDSMSKLISRFGSDLDDVIKFANQLKLRSSSKMSLLSHDESVKTTETKIDRVLMMKRVIRTARALFELISSSRIECFDKICQVELNDEEKFKKIENEIDGVFDEDEHVGQRKKTINSLVHKSFLVKSNINGMLDMSRKAYLELNEELNKYLIELSTKHQMVITCHYNMTRGYYFQVQTPTVSSSSRRSRVKLNVANLSHTSSNNTLNNSTLSSQTDSSMMTVKTFKSLPAEFVRVIKSNNKFQFSTKFLERFNERTLQSIEEIYNICSNILNDMLARIVDHLDIFERLGDCISTLDMIKSLVDYVKRNSREDRVQFVRPVMSDLNTPRTLLKSTFHPILIHANSRAVETINLNKYRSMQLIMGSNMSGKTTLLKQIGSLQIMSQCGSYIPVSIKSNSTQLLTPMQRICSISCDFSDTAHALSQSSFEQEMYELSQILSLLDDRETESNMLLLIDELCRSTYFLEGFSIALAVCEYFLSEYLSSRTSSNQIFVLYATHFKYLAYMESFYPRLNTMMLKSELRRQEEIKPTLDVKALLDVLPLPQSIIQEAYESYNRMTINLDAMFELNTNQKKKRLIFKLYNELYDLWLDWNSDPNPENGIKFLDRFEQSQLEFHTNYKTLF